LLWLVLLAVVALATDDQIRTGVVAGTVLLAALWTVATVAVAARAPVLLRSPLWLAADIAVAAATIALSSLAEANRGITGGFPFSTVALAAYGGGYAGGFAAAVVLATVSIIRLGASEAVGSSLVYLAGAGVIVWAIDVIRRNEAARRALEQQLAAEEAARARSQERADTAAALHDSVLQTLALIQRRSSDPAAVTNLARRSERDLRDWLAGRGRLDGGNGVTFSQALTDAAAGVEADYPLTVDVVTVGEAPLDEPLTALVAATREAIVNVAKHAEVPGASVYAEITEAAITVFIRDRGRGFDPDLIPADRRGITESIAGRLQRYDGTTAVRSTIGSGTEVELRLPRKG
jgi:signal transduction histidine kinase